MAKLSTEARKKLPSSDFLGPNRSFPVPDKAHARAAVRLAPRAEHAGSITPKQESHIVNSAKKMLANATDKMTHQSKSDGSMMPHEKPVMDPDNTLGLHNFKRGAVHPDSKGNRGLDGDGAPGASHWTGH